jgi:hypothetical protein
VNESPSPPQQTRTVTWEGASHTVRVRVPTARQVVPLWIPPARRTPPLVRGWLAVELRAWFSELDGAPVDRPTADRLVAHREALSALLKLRETALNEARMQGVVYLLCASCGHRDTSLSLDALAAATGASLPALAEPGPGPARGAGTGTLPAPPALADLGWRPRQGNPRAAVSLKLPSGHPASLVPLDPGEERETFARLVATPPPPGQTHRRMEHATYRSLVRLALMLRRGDGSAPTPEDIESFPVSDVAFLDAAAHLLWAAPLSGAPRAVACSRCGAPLLPGVSDPPP